MVVPNGWVIKQIKELTEIIGGGTPSTSVQSFWEGTITWVVPSDITSQKNKYIESSVRQISTHGLNNSAAVILPIGTIIVCSRATIGEIAISLKPLATNQGFKNLVCNSEIYNEFLYYTLQPLKVAMIKYATGSTFLELSKTTIGNIEICLPPLPEQTAIATALSDIDSYITSLEKLIKKKKAIKQGVMQELLTRKKRLPGFTAEWTITDLASLCDTFVDGDWIELKDQSIEGIRLIQTGNVGNGKYLNKPNKSRFISKNTFTNLNCTEVFTNDVLVSRLPDPIGRACIVPKGLGKTITVVDCTVIRFRKYNPVFFVMFTQTNEYQRQVDVMMSGSTRQRISRKELGMVKVPYFDIEEQTAISNILSNIDSEIEILMKKLEKIKNIKLGMMSELLTGRIRIAETPAVAQEKLKKQKISKLKVKSTEKKHKGAFWDAVLLATLVQKFGSNQYPFTKFDAQKFPYIFHRYLEGKTEGYIKQAAGPYNPDYVYKTARPIAIKRNYIKPHKGFYFGFIASDNIAEAEKYFHDKYGGEALNWMVDNFRFLKDRKNELELLTTVDMSMLELHEKGDKINWQTVKQFIADYPEWKAKLTYPYFSDSEIERAIKWSDELFGGILCQR